MHGEGFSGVALDSLDLVSLDTETTGLDPTNDRVVEIGAVRLSAGRVVHDETFSRLVNPAVPIPPQASQIHSITDADVADAPGFADAMGAYAAWSGEAVIIGYAIGFDLAVLSAEHERAGLVWRPPRSLDVRELAAIVAPNLPEQSLDVTASWLGIEIADRHRALPDAVATARVFADLVPKLRERGIITLAQAERACRVQKERMSESTAVGWQSSGPVEQGAGTRVYARIDSFPYRHRVADMMSAPPKFAQNETRLKDTLTMMVNSEVSSLFLPPGASGGAPGIITERDVMRAIEAHGGGALDQATGDFGKRPLVTIDHDEFAYRALVRMAKGGFRHLGVIDGSGDLVGALSARDLLRQRADDAISLGDEIESATTPAELGRVWSQLTSVTRALVDEDVDARDIAAIISRELQALTRRACEIAETELAAQGRAAPPVPYALMVLGSGGRGESLLAMDQDNALVIADGQLDDAAQQWFADLGQRLTDILDHAGVAYCKGGVMASNPAWRMDQTSWRATVETWINGSRPQDLLNSDIFFDARAVYGDAGLVEGLRADSIDAARNSRTFLKFLALNASRFDDSIGWFGRIKTDGERIDLKARGIMPLFSAARVLALKHGITAHSTLDRLQAAKAESETLQTKLDNLIEAHRVLLRQILCQQLRDIDRGIALSNKINPAEISNLEKQELKWALQRIPSIHEVLDTPLID